MVTPVYCWYCGNVWPGLNPAVIGSRGPLTGVGVGVVAVLGPSPIRPPLTDIGLLYIFSISSFVMDPSREMFTALSFRLMINQYKKKDKIVANTIKNIKHLKVGCLKRYITTCIVTTAGRIRANFQILISKRRFCFLGRFCETTSGLLIFK